MPTTNPARARAVRFGSRCPAVARSREQVPSRQTAVIGFSVVANQRAFVDTLVRRIVAFIESLAVAKLVDDEIDIITYGDEKLQSARDFESWEPDFGPEESE